jgi:VanZ family protein
MAEPNVIPTSGYPELRIRDWLPPVLWAGLILVASSDLFSASHTSLLIEPLLRWLFPKWNEAQILHAHFLVRKMAHVTEYGILGLLMFRPLALRARATVTKPSWRIALTAVVLCATVAVVDESHQHFVASRTGSPWDVLLDAFGATLFLTMVGMWRTLRAGRRAEALQR